MKAVNCTMTSTSNAGDEPSITTIEGKNDTKTALTDLRIIPDTITAICDAPILRSMPYYPQDTP